ncbi:MAG: nucleoside-diphosphate kinase [Candidatus Bathyarchaeia archaeon]
MERTLLLVKPDGVMRGLIGEVISRIERKGLKIAGLKILTLTKEQAESLYSIHRTKEFYPRLIRHITSGPVAAVVIEGPDCVRAVRRVVGATNPQEATPGSIRGDLALNTTENVVHAADSVENAEYEIEILFKQYEMNHSKPAAESRYQR